MKLLRVDMNQHQAHWEPVPAMYERLGGRALIVKLLLEEIPPACDALGPHNKLIFAPGLLGGVNVTTCGRLSVGGKSPLTRGVKEANAACSVVAALAALAGHTNTSPTHTAFTGLPY
jgi:aldehyde:ferredoxin oxidoreductase